MIDDPLDNAPPQSHHLVLSSRWIDRPIWIEEKTRMEVQISLAARAAMTKAGMLMATLLKRHFTGDWGMVDPAVAARNEGACRTGGSVVSIHRVAGANVCVETFAGHTMTWIALAEEREPSAKRRDHLRPVPNR